MRRQRIGIVAALAMLLAWWLLQRPDSEMAVGPSPTDSYRARTGRIMPQPPPRLPPEGENAEPEDAEPEWRKNDLVIVHLRDAADGFLTFPKTAALDPSTYWPLPGEAPFAYPETAGALQDLIAEGGDEQDWLDLAMDEGLFDVDPLEQPWDVALLMEWERRAALVDQGDAYDELGLPLTEMVRLADAVGPPELDGMLDMADLLIDVHPDHPAAEYARLYLLDALVREQDPDARDVALDVLRHTDDALVTGQAVSLLTRLPKGDALSTADLDRLESLVQRFPEAVQALDVAAWGLDHAMRHDDHDRTSRWLALLEADIAATCNPPSLLDEPACLTHEDNVDDVVAYVGDLGPDEARDWKQAVALAAYACAREGHGWDAFAGYRVEAVWEPGWQFGAWEPETEYTRCVQAGITAGPEPELDEPMDVRVAVVR